MEYTKPPRTIHEQLDLLSDRRMIIDNPPEAEKFLLHVNYYRFCGYALHYEIFENRTRTHRYRKGTTFSQVMHLYEFDDKLRSILFDYIGHFEIAFRSLFCYEASILLEDSHWHMKKKHFDNRFDFHGFISGCHSEIKRSSEVFIKSYYGKYEKPILPAVWMLTEILSLGRWSKMYASLVHKGIKKKISDRFGVPHVYIESWIKGITELRNHCAHHNRIWNRQFTSALLLFKGKKDRIDNRSLAGYIFVLNELLKPLGKQKNFSREIQNLFHDYQDIPKEPMGCDTAFCKEMGLTDE
jgi:abortive infection bacteriophage resistance protein